VRSNFATRSSICVKPPRFGASIQPGYGRTVVHLAGELDIAAGLAVEGALVCAVDLGAPTIVLDLSRVTFIDAYVIGLIVDARKNAADRGALLRVSGVQGPVAHLFVVTRLAHLVVTEADAGAAEADDGGG
jgi:anti-anti-sigma factor